MTALTHDEILRLLRASSNSPRNLAMLCLGYKHGLRASEICNLHVDDLDLKNQQINIRRLKNSLQTTQPLADLPGQPLLSELKLINGWLKLRQDSSSFLFTSGKGGRLSRVQMFRIYRTAARLANLPPQKQHPHCLKHSLGYTLVQQNVHLTHIKLALGHRNINSTLVYTQPTQDQVNIEVSRALANVF